jgi:hypothetical protein
MINEKLQAGKVRKADLTSKNTAIQRCIDMIQWPQCPIEAETVIQHFTEA